MRELRPGLRHWGAAPGWTAGEPWPQEVSSYAIDDGGGPTDRAALEEALS